MNAAARVIMNLSLSDNVKPALKQLQWLPVQQRIILTSCVCWCTRFITDKHHNTCQTVYPQFLQPVTDTGWGRLAQWSTFCLEQEPDLENVVFSTPVPPPGTLFLPTSTTLLCVSWDVKPYTHSLPPSTTLLIPVLSENDSSVLFDRVYHWLLLALLDVSYSGTLQIAWLIDWLTYQPFQSAI